MFQLPPPDPSKHCCIRDQPFNTEIFVVQLRPKPQHTKKKNNYDSLGKGKRNPTQQLLRKQCL